MKYLQLNYAYPILKEIANCKLAISKAYELYNLLKKLENAYSFFQQEMKKNIEKYNAIQDGQTLAFKDEQDKTNFFIATKELENFEIQEKFSPIELTFSDVKQMSFSPQDLFLLEGFIIFSKGEN